MSANDLDKLSDEGQSASSEEPRTRRFWLVLAAVPVAGSLAIGVLNVVGAGTGPVVNIVVVLMLVAGFLAAVAKALEEQLSEASRRTRRAYAAGVVACALLLLVAGLVTRTVAPLHRMPGTSDVAVIGFAAPSEDDQTEYDDLASAMADALPEADGSEVRSYAGEIAPPLEQLRPRQDLAELDGWLEEFLQETDAELVLAGYAEPGNAGQTTLRTVAYVPGKVSSDAAELSGWYVLDDFLTDRTVDSARIRRALLDRVTTQLGGLTSFLTGLDAWQSGFAADAIAAFSKAIPSSSRGSGLADLARLFRGHAIESRAQAVSPADRRRLLEKAHQDYAAIPASSTVANRARVSTATNDYLRALLAGCDPKVEVTSHLDASASVLHEIGIAADLPELLRRRAQVNQAQVELCRLRAGRAGAAASLDSLLGGLTRMSLPEGDANGDAYRQVKALALSIQAIRDSDAGRPDEAAETMGRALDLDPRFERQAPWLGLRSAWLLKTCRLDDGTQAQQQALIQVRAAVQSGRLPNSEVEKYASAFKSDLGAARRRCGEG